LKKIPLLITVGILALIVGGYFFYEKVLLRDPLTPWDLVPAETILIYEKDVCTACIEQMQQSTVWNIVERASLVTKPGDSLISKLNGLVKQRPGLLISAHITKKDDFDLVYYLPDAKNLLPQVSRLAGLKNYRLSEREFNEVKINEVTFQKHTFSWAIIQNVWVGSFTSFLLEDVIRTYKGKRNFRQTNPEIRQLPRITGDAGNVYIQLKKFSEWLAIFMPAEAKPFAMGKSALLDIKSVNDNLVFNGFSLDSASYSNYFLSIFRNQSPVAFSLKNSVPNRAITFTSYGINDGAAFHDALQRFVSAHRPHLRDSLDRLSATLKFEWKDLFSEVTNEIGVCQVDGTNNRKLSKLLMIETRSADKWLKRLDAISDKLSVDTIFHERFSNYVIREIPLRRFPEKLLWPLVQGFDHTYYSSFNNVIIMGDNLEELKLVLEDIEEEDIWGKSVSKNQFLESTLLESNVSLFINTPKVWNLLVPRLQPRWRQFVRDNQNILQSVQMSAFQFSHLNNTYYTNVTIQHSKEKPEVAFASSSRKNVVHFSQAIHKLHPVRSHISRANEILIQDSLNDVSLLSMEGKVFWKIPVGDQITSGIDQIDFLNNGKLQYIFATRDAIHIIDRLGNYVAPYPLRLAGKDIEQLSVVDYDRSKKYRFLVSEKNGRLWMYDKTGENLEGWTPCDAGGELLVPPAHHRIKGKDYIVAFRKDGYVNLYNRRGGLLKNFPLNLQGRPQGDYFLEMGPNVSTTYFVVITRDGYRVKFNPEGRIENRETLLRASVGAEFSLIPEKANKSYLILQHDSQQVILADESGRKIIANGAIGQKNLDIKYYQYGGGKTFITLTDRVQELSYVFDGNGALLTSPPFESSAIELRLANSDQSYVFFIHGKTLTIQPLIP
jgi:hypothetical protein